MFKSFIIVIIEDLKNIYDMDIFCDSFNLLKSTPNL